jgi:AraC-like DNA-binding protein
MDIFNLPQDISPGKTDLSEHIIFHHYSAPIGSFHGKSILHKNAISLIITGEKTMHFANKMIKIKDDEFHMLSAGNCIVSMNLSEKTVFSSVLVFFDNSCLSDFYLKYAGIISAIKDNHKIVSEPYLAFKKDDFVRNFISSLVLLSRPGLDTSVEMKQLKFEELMLHLLEKYPHKLLSFTGSVTREFDDLEIRKVVETNITNPVKVEELAFLCNISLSTFKRRFIKIYGTPPGKWIVNKRMEMARHLLLHYHEKPGEVYYKVGYENHSSFTQSFKQVYGITPRELQAAELTLQQ